VKSSSVVNPPFNVSVPARLNATFIHIDEESDATVSWMPHPDLAKGIRNRRVDAVWPGAS
jgi:hypothetical protein